MLNLAGILTALCENKLIVMTYIHCGLLRGCYVTVCSRPVNSGVRLYLVNLNIEQLCIVKLLIYEGLWQLSIDYTCAYLYGLLLPITDKR